MKNMISFKELREVLEYQPDTGLFYWIGNPPNRTKNSRLAGTETGGYIQIQINYKIYRAHRLAWLYMTGSFPVLEIDHINGNPSDNRWLNLREVDSVTNKQNRHIARSDCKSGLIGAHFHKKHGWRSSIKVDGKYINLGYFPDAESAHQAYLKKKREVHHGNTQ
jgi:hypothetical protein